MYTIMFRRCFSANITFYATVTENIEHTSTCSKIKRLRDHIFYKIYFIYNLTASESFDLTTPARHNASSASGSPACCPLAGIDHVLWPQAYETSCSLAGLRSYARHECFHHHPSHPRSADRLPTTSRREPDTESHGESITANRQDRLPANCYPGKGPPPSRWRSTSTTTTRSSR